MANKKIPRGVRNNNPGNIRLSKDKWQGLSQQQTDSSFSQFTDPVWGIRALAVLLINYQDKYGLRTVKAIIDRWAPPVENNTASYVNEVVKAMNKTGLNITATTTIDLHQYEDLFALVSAIIRHENGAGGEEKTRNEWYKDDVVNEALRRAGVVKTTKKVVTPTSVSALAAGGVGIDQLVGALPSVTSAINSSRDDLTSGDWSRIIIGVIMVGAAIALAYSHWRRQKLATA